jgi:hypothetical protein
MLEVIKNETKVIWRLQNNFCVRLMIFFFVVTRRMCVCMCARVSS